jgi:putative hydrolase of the HAD superfamily
MIKALIFDLDDTLVIEQASAEAAFLETCELAKTKYGINPQELNITVRNTCRKLWHQSPARQYCLDIGISSWEGLWAKFIGENRELRILQKWVPTYRLDSWYNALCRHGINDIGFSMILAEAFRENRRKRHLIYDDVLPTLVTLKKSYLLGLLSNGTPDLQNEKIDGAGIRSFFHEIIISGELGVGKPDHSIYQIMLSRLRVKPDHAVMVGDSLKSDIQGAKDVSMKTVWINRDGKSRDQSIIPAFEISSINELMNIL